MKEYVKGIEYFPVLNPTEQFVYRRAKLDAQADTGRFYLNSMVKGEIAKEAGRSTESVKAAITTLRRNRVILPAGPPGMYTLNPFFHWKGSDPSRRMALKELEEKGSPHLPEILDAAQNLTIPFEVADEI